MASWKTPPDRQRYKLGLLKTRLKCLQINLQHSRAATDNLTKIINGEETDVCIQDPYNIGNKVVGLPQSYAVFTSGAGRKRAAIALNNKRIDTILLTQLSNDDTVVVGTRVDNASFILVTMYFDINRPIDIDLQKMQEILTHSEGVGTIFAIDSNARSTSWNDVLTNKQGKTMEEFLISRQL